jgi:hypothetical protein
MEVLFVAPVALLMGALLIYLSTSSNQAPRPVAVAIKEPVMKRRQSPLPSKAQPFRTMTSRTARGITQADVLLADVLSELLELRQEAATMRGSVEKLSADLEELKQTVHSLKRPSRKAS